MKVVKKIIFFILPFLCIQTNALSEPILKIGSTNVLPGGQASLELNLVGGTQEYAGVNAQIVLPIGFSVSKVNRGNLLSENFFINWKVFDLEDSKYVTVIAYSNIDLITSSNGVIFEIIIKANDNICPQKIPTPFINKNINTKVNTNHAISNTDGSESVLHHIEPGSIRIEGIIIGDLNNDESVDLKDAITAMNILCGIAPEKMNSVSTISSKESIGLKETIYILNIVTHLNNGCK